MVAKGTWFWLSVCLFFSPLSYEICLEVGLPKTLGRYVSALPRMKILIPESLTDHGSARRSTDEPDGQGVLDGLPRNEYGLCLVISTKSNHENGSST